MSPPAIAADPSTAAMTLTAVERELLTSVTQSSFEHLGRNLSDGLARLVDPAERILDARGIPDKLLSESRAVRNSTRRLGAGHAASSLVRRELGVCPAGIRRQMLIRADDRRRSGIRGDARAGLQFDVQHATPRFGT